jgi:hypothetical protein
MTAAAEYSISPEVAGDFGEDSILDRTKHPPVVSRLHYEFAGWDGDDIVATFPVTIVTDALANAISEHGLTGVEFDDVIVTKDPQFETFLPTEAAALPKWQWLRPVGRPHAADFWQKENGELVVSDKALRLLRQFHLNHAEIEEAAPNS